MEQRSKEEYQKRTLKKILFMNAKLIETPSKIRSPQQTPRIKSSRGEPQEERTKDRKYPDG